MKAALYENIHRVSKKLQKALNPVKI